MPALAFWGVEIVDVLLVPAPGLDVYGIRPRSEAGLYGIVLAPLLHGGFSHVAANTGPFLVLGGLVAARSLREYLRLSLTVTLLGGLLVWLIGAPHSIHIGASGVVFGYFGYLLRVGWVERHPAWILVSLGVALLYGGLVFGVFPSSAFVSWESHASGFGIGLVMAGRRRAR